MIENYEDKNVEDTLDAISGYDATRLQQFLVYEREHKNRKTIINAIRDQLITVEVPDTGYYGGFWFDEGGEYVVRDTPRLRKAAEKTRLDITEE